jgi:hypothetical protein
MPQRLKYPPGWFLILVLLLGLVILGWCGSRWLAAEPGSAEEMYADVRIGMTRDEVVAIFRTHWYIIDGLYSEGTTLGEHSWSRCHVTGPAFHDLPPSSEVRHCVLTVLDRTGREVEVVIGADGLVSDKRITPGVLRDRLDGASRALAGAAEDLSSEAWWRQQARKMSRSMRWKWPYLAICAVVGVVLASAWLLRRGLGRAEPIA